MAIPPTPENGVEVLRMDAPASKLILPGSVEDDAEAAGVRIGGERAVAFDVPSADLVAGTDAQLADAARHHVALPCLLYPDARAALCS
jgi:hypothetical protein